MNTQIHVEAFGAPGRNASAAVTDLFRRSETIFSRFDPASELSRLNNSPQTQVAISSTLAQVLDVALWAARTTGGLLDPTVLPALEAAGYDRSFEQIGDGLDRPERTPAKPGGATFRSVTLHHQGVGEQTITRPVGVRLDMGGVGKGWTVDRAAELLLGQGPFLVNAGGDLYAHGYPADPRGWAIELQNPLRPDDWLARVYVANRALATSSIAKRRWMRNGLWMHHLIDPRTGRPAETDLLSVTVVASRTAVAETFAKAALIQGSGQGMAYLDTQPGVEGMALDRRGRLLVTAGFAPYLDAVASEHKSRS